MFDNQLIEYVIQKIVNFKRKEFGLTLNYNTNTSSTLKFGKCLSFLEPYTNSLV